MIAGLGRGGETAETADPLVGLAGRIKAELRRRFERGERPTVREYLDRFPQLRAAGERVISLVYEEYCLLEERGERPDPDSFCDRYEPWRDSLASQLRYHRLLSQAVVAPPKPKYPMPGERFHDFELRSVLGEGGAARVYLAREEPLGGREVALKVSAGGGAEASIQGRLDHTHIVPVWSVHDDPETGFRGLCMPYRPGLSLDQVIRRVEPGARPRRALTLWQALLDGAAIERRERPGGPGWQGFPIRGTYPEAVAWVGAALARALDYAHGQGVLHRDVKPANVLLTVRDGPQLLDFNLAHDPNAPDRAEAALRGGTLPYMAPEQLEAFLDSERWEQVGPGADLYALGLLLREFLTGRRPEAHDPELPLPRAINELLDRRAEPWPSLRRDNPTVPHGLDAIVARCLAHDPADRYQRASDLAEDLQRFVEHRRPRVAVNPSRREVAGNWVRRHRLALIAIPSVALALALGPGWYEWVGSRTWNRNAAPQNMAIGWERLANGQLPQAKQAFAHVLWLDSTSFRAYQGLGAVAFKAGDFARSHADYSRAIAGFQAARPRLPESRLAPMLVDRARVNLEWAKSLQRGGTAAALDAARPHFARALVDLERARRLDRGPAAGLVPIDFLIATAKLGLGDAASSRDRYRESVAHFAAAEALLLEIDRLKPADPQIATKIREARQRLAADRPKLDREPTADRPGRRGTATPPITTARQP